MATQPPNDPSTQAAPGGMFGRIQRIILQPRAEWQRIDAEPMTVGGIFTGWVLPLAAIGPVAGFIGQQLFPIMGFRPSLSFGLVTAILAYGLTVLGIWLSSIVIDALAPSFDSTKNPVQAMKVAAFSWTPFFIAGIFSLIPQLTIIGLLLGLFSFFLLWVGLPLLMKTPADKAAVYVIVAIVAMIVVYIVVSTVARMVAGALVFNTTAPIGYTPPA